MTTLLSESEAIRRRELIEIGRSVHQFATDLGRRDGVTIALTIDGDGRAHFETYDPKTKTASRRLPDALAQKIRANRDALREYVASILVASPPRRWY